MALVPDEPKEITIQLSRMEFITQKAVRLIPDDSLGGEEDTNGDMDNKGFDHHLHSYVWSEGDSRAEYTECVPAEKKERWAQRMAVLLLIYSWLSMEYQNILKGYPCACCICKGFEGLWGDILHEKCVLV